MGISLPPVASDATRVAVPRPPSAVDRYLAAQRQAQGATDRSAAENVVRGIPQGLAETGTSSLRLTARLADLLTHAAPALPAGRSIAAALSRGSDALESFANTQEDQAREFYDPQGTAGEIGRFGGRMLGEGVLTVAGGRGVASALQHGPDALAKAIAAGSKGTAAQRAAANIVPFAPVDFAAGVGGARDPENALQEGAMSLALGSLGGSLIEVGGRLFRRMPDGSLTLLEEAARRGTPTTIQRRATAGVNLRSEPSTHVDLATALADAPGRADVERYFQVRGRDVPGPGIARRPQETLPISQRQPVEFPDAEAQSFSGISFGDATPTGIRRRPAGDIPTVPPSAPASAVERYLQAASETRPNPVSDPIPTLDAPVSVAREGPVPAASTAGDRVTLSPEGGRAARKAPPDTPSPGIAGEDLQSLPARVTGPEEVTSVAGVQAAATPRVEPSATPDSPTDVLNVAKLNASQSAQDRLAAQVEQFRSLRDSQRQTWSDADLARESVRKDMLLELAGGDPKALAPDAAKRLSGEEILARRDIVSANDELLDRLSKEIDAGTLPQAQHEEAIQALDQLTRQTDALLSDLVIASSQKGRDLNLLRRMANRSLDYTTWMVQAKRMLGDLPMTDEITDEVRRLTRAAVDACGGAA